MEDSGIDSDPKATSHIEDERLFLVNIYFAIASYVFASVQLIRVNE